MTLDLKLRPFHLKKSDFIPFVGAFGYMRRVEKFYGEVPPTEACKRVAVLMGANFAYLALEYAAWYML